MGKSKTLIYLVLSCAFIFACNLPSSQSPEATPTAEELEDQIAGTLTALAPPAQQAGTATFTSIAPLTATNPPAFTATPCSPTVTATVNANVRSGPGTVYPQVGSLLVGQSAAVAGKNAESTWWYIVFPAASGGYAWIAGSTVTASCLPASVTVIPAPPTPPVAGTCKPGFVYRLINANDKVCVPPASKAQADADNAAANSRKLVTVYGPNACKPGFVWREAFPGDMVCVTPATRSQAQADNAAAASRWVDGPYGPHTCISGYVWREATAGDDVCVTPDVRSQTAADNAAAASRVAGPDDCISGYVWREAFPGDRVCVTPDVKAQVQADNAAAPSRTY